MRQVTSLPHDTQEVGVLWDGKNGNFDNWGRQPVAMIVLHSMDGYVAGTTQWFRTHNQSAQYGIGMDGKITSWIPEDQVAYHAGKYSINQVSIGIEHEDNGNNQIQRTEELYKTSAQLVADICKEYNIPCNRDNIKKHNEIVATACPGTLDIERIVSEASRLLTPVTMVEVKSDVFTNLVTKSSEYDEVWKALSLDSSMQTRVGSHTLVLDYIAAKVTEAQNNVPQAPVAGVPSANDSFLTKDVGQIVSEFLMFLKLKKNTNI